MHLHCVELMSWDLGTCCVCPVRGRSLTPAGRNNDVLRPLTASCSVSFVLVIFASAKGQSAPAALLRCGKSHCASACSHGIEGDSNETMTPTLHADVRVEQVQQPSPVMCHPYPNCFLGG